MFEVKVLVTGGCGFQGSHLVEALVKEGHSVRVLNTVSDHAKRNYDRYLEGLDIEVLWGTVLDMNLLSACMQDVDKVFHLAAKINVDESIYDPKGFVENNVGGTKQVLEGCRDDDVPVVFASSCEVYGGNLYGQVNVLEAVRKYKKELVSVSSASVFGDGSKELMDEFHPMRPRSPYAASKAAADVLCSAYHCTYDLDVKIVRPFNVYGERQKERGFGSLIPILFRCALEDKPLRIFGDGEQTRDYMHVSDVVRAYIHVANETGLSGGVVNVGSGVQVSVNEIAEKVIELTGRDRGLIKHIGGRPGEVDSFIADTSLMDSYGFRPKVNFDEGLRYYYEWKIRGCEKDEQIREGPEGRN